MVNPELTPPHSSKSSVFRDAHTPVHKIGLEHTSDPETLGLIGTTRFEPLHDVKNIMITGGAGFIGGWVTRHLTIQYPEYNILCFDKLDEVSSRANIDCLQQFPNFHFVQGDLVDQDVVARVLNEYEIDCIIHFAACSHVQSSFDDPSSFTVNNVIATQRLLDAVRHHRGEIRRFIHVSTDEVYGDAVAEFVTEDKQFKPTNPYSASKAAAEMYVWAYAQSFDIPIVVVRSNNVYGPGQFIEKIIPRFFVLLSQHRPLTIQGSGLNVRRYLYGTDAANGFDTILHKGAVGEAYNLMSSFGVTNLEVAVRMLELWGFSPQHDFGKQITWIEDRPFNDHDYRVDGSKVMALGWRQQTSFSEGLRLTVDWYRRSLSAWWPHVAEKIDFGWTETTSVHRRELSSNSGVKHAAHNALLSSIASTSPAVAVAD